MTDSQGTQSLPPPALPQLVATQHVPIPATDKDTKRLIVVLSNACLESIKVGTSAAPRAGKPGIVKDEKHTLLNSDEHIGLLRKMNRDIGDARPDITHQVRFAMMNSDMGVIVLTELFANSASSHYSTPLSTKPDYCRSTFTRRTTFLSKSLRPCAFRVHSSASQVSWYNSCTSFPSAARPHPRNF